MSRIGKDRIDGYRAGVIPSTLFLFRKRKPVLKKKRGVPYVVQIHEGAEY